MSMIKEIELFVERINEHLDDITSEEYRFNFNEKQIEIGGGRKYIKLMSGRSVFAFVEAATGDIYKPASWSAPAKHVRGNITSNFGGFEALQFCEMGLVHVKYLR